MIDVIRMHEENIEDFASFFPDSVLYESLNDEKIELYGILSDSTAAGGIAIRRKNPEAQLLWVHVADSMAGDGIGKDALTDLFIDLFKDGISDVRVMVVPGADQRFKRLLRVFDFEFKDSDNGSYTCRLGDLREKKNLKPESKNSIALSELTANEYVELFNFIESSGSDMFLERPDRKDFDGALSSVYVEDKKLMGCFLVKEDAPGALRVAFMFSESEDPIAPIDMMRFSLGAARELPADTGVSFDLVNEDLIGFIEERVGGKVERSKEGVLDLSGYGKYIEECERFFSFYDPVVL